MAKTIILVSCVSQKQAVASLAKDLYVSDWFRKAATFAQRNSDAWYILSAKYGLVDPDQMIEPYNVTLNRMPAAARRLWAQSVTDDLRSRLNPGDKVIFLAGKRYRENLIEPVRQMGCTVEIPMQGLGIGKQLRWLKEHSGG